MVKLIGKWVEAYRSLRNYRRCRRAIAKADRLAKDGQPHVVLMLAGRPRVFSQQRLRYLVQQGVFTLSARKLRAMAIYKTR